MDWNERVETGGIDGGSGQKMQHNWINTTGAVDRTARLTRYTLAQVKTKASGVKTMLSVFMLAMVLHPKIQQKAQAEIDEVLQGSLPTFEDRY